MGRAPTAPTGFLCCPQSCWGAVSAFKPVVSLSCEEGTAVRECFNVLPSYGAGLSYMFSVR